MPRRRAELKARCIAAQDRRAKRVMFSRPKNASTVPAKLSMHVACKAAVVSELVLCFKAGRYSSEVT